MLGAGLLVAVTTASVPLLFGGSVLEVGLVSLDVPIIAVNADAHMRLKNGRLADVTPTLLDLLGIEKPPQMTGHSLVERELQTTEMAR